MYIYRVYPQNVYTLKVIVNVCDSIAWRGQQCLDQNGRQFENRQ